MRKLQQVKHCCIVAIMNLPASLVAQLLAITPLKIRAPINYIFALVVVLALWRQQIEVHLKQGIKPLALTLAYQGSSTPIPTSVLASVFVFTILPCARCTSCCGRGQSSYFQGALAHLMSSLRYSR